MGRKELFLSLSLMSPIHIVYLVLEERATRHLTRGDRRRVLLSAPASSAAYLGSFSLASYSVHLWPKEPRSCKPRN